VVAYLLLVSAQVVGLLLIPFGAPGLWIQVFPVALYGWWSGFAVIGVAPILAIFMIALTAELIESPLTGGRMRRELRRSASLAGLVGGGVGSAAGTVFAPLVGSLFGALTGALLGTALIAPIVRPPLTGLRGLIGQIFAISIRTGASVAIAAFVLLSLGP
jgi:hypothetical protein